MSYSRWKTLTVILVLLLPATILVAETYYVRTDGQDNNSGLADSPLKAWRTIQHAADNVAPGDTVLIQAGSYDEVVQMNSQGTEELPITFIGEGDVYVSAIVFPGSSVFSQAVTYYVILDHFIFDGYVSPAAYGVYLRAGRFVTIRNSTFKNFRGEINEYPWGTWGATRVGLRFANNAWASSYSLTVKNTTFSNNDVGATGQMLQASLFDQCLFSGNTYGFAAQNWGTRYTTISRSIFDNNGTGVYLAGVYWYWLKTHHNTIYRSIFTNNETGLLIGDNLATEDGAASYANSVVNSNFYGNLASGIVVNTNFLGVLDSVGPEWFDLQGQTLTNSIFQGNGAYGLDNAVNQTIFPSYNLAHDNVVAHGNNAVFDVGNNSLTVDPLFTDPANANFNLRVGSPARDVGNPDYDDDADVVDGEVDIGAIEANDPSTTDIVLSLLVEVDDIPESFLKNKNNSLPLSKKLYVALQLIRSGDQETDPAKAYNYYHAALQKLGSDILPKTDGCAVSGLPDSNDWITDCATQADFHGPIVATIDMLEMM